MKPTTETEERSMPERVWIALDREVAERILPDEKPDLETFMQNAADLTDACRKALDSECVEVGGKVINAVKWVPAETMVQAATHEKRLTGFDTLPDDFPEGPCTLIVIAGERDG